MPRAVDGWVWNTASVMQATPLSVAVDALDVLESGLATSDQILEASEFVDALGAAYRQIKERYEQAAVAYIKANGEIRSGERRLWVEPNTTVKCTDVKGTLQALLEVTGGDLEAVVGCLASDAWKQGQTRKVLGDRAEGLFETKVTSKVKSEGGEAKEVERLQDVNYADVKRFRK